MAAALSSSWALPHREPQARVSQIKQTLHTLHVRLSPRHDAGKEARARAGWCSLQWQTRQKLLAPRPADEIRLKQTYSVRCWYLVLHVAQHLRTARRSDLHKSRRRLMQQCCPQNPVKHE